MSYAKGGVWNAQAVKLCTMDGEIDVAFRGHSNVISSKDVIGITDELEI